MGASMLRRMDAAQALADLTEISSQVEQVAIVDLDGSLLASTARDPVRAERFVSGITRLLDEADRLAKSRGLAELTQLEVSTLGGSVFVVRRNGRMVAATTRADPTVGLIFYDLKHCLGSIEETPGAEPPPEPAASRKQSDPGARREAPVRSTRRKADSSA
jgi:predicted regulator of Ras-like GTPase activity (Roadblock/LC7/MglB family)